MVFGMCFGMVGGKGCECEFMLLCLLFWLDVWVEVVGIWVVGGFFCWLMEKCFVGKCLWGIRCYWLVSRIVIVLG